MGHPSREPGPLLDRLLATRIVPVVVLDEPGKARPLADALVAGGLPASEVTLRSGGALAVLKEMAGNSAILTGAGTVRTAEQASRCIEAGAQFLVSPGVSEEVIRTGQEASVPVIPGVATGTEIMRAAELGVTTVKLFPASVVGGPPAVRALAGPFPEVRFVPTGGIDESNAADYLSLQSVAAIGGTWMVAPALLASGDFDEIKRRTAAARSIVDAINT